MAFVTAGLLAGAALSGGAYLVDRLAVATIRPLRNNAYDTDPAHVPYPTRAVEFQSSDGTLRGWLFEPRGTPKGPLAVLVHGWSANAGTVLRLGRPLLEAGFPVMAFDVRGHGSSDSAPFVTIRHYRDDVLAALRYAEAELPFARRVVIGHSMGAAAAVLATARGAPVHGLCLVAGPADIMDVTEGYLTDQGLPGALVVRLCLPSWRLRAAEPFADLSPEDSLGSVGVPVRIVQGSDDRRVRPHHAHRLAVAAGVSVTEVFGRGHTDVLDSQEAHDTMRELLTSTAV